MMALAARNGIRLRWDTADALRQAYKFENLSSFLGLYFEGCKVLVTERDFREVTIAYLGRAREGRLRTSCSLCATAWQPHSSRKRSGRDCSQTWNAASPPPASQPVPKGD